MSCVRCDGTYDGTRKELLYEHELGEEAAERQRRLAKQLHRCCGEWKGGPHHAACKNFVELELAPHPDQMGLL